MFDSHELVYTHNLKTGQYSGGGYALKSELLTGGAPALISLSGGGGNKRRNRRPRSESGSGSGSGSGSDSGSGNESDGKHKVSSIIAGKSSIVIPAGLFLIHGPNRANDDNDDYTDTNSAKIRSLLYNSGSDVSENDSMDGIDSDTEGDARKKNGRRDNVIPDDIYTALFKMLSPNESDKKRYWVGSAVTCKRRRNKNLISAPSTSTTASTSAQHKTTRKHKK